MLHRSHLVWLLTAPPLEIQGAMGSVDVFGRSHSFTCFRAGIQRRSARKLPVPPREPKNNMVLGDTGCRVSSSEVQNCNGDGEGEPWAFAQVADSAAKMKPDLIIHVGPTSIGKPPATAETRTVRAVPMATPGLPGRPISRNKWNMTLYSQFGKEEAVYEVAR